MRRLLVLLLLSTLAYVAVPASAQDRRTQERLRSLEELRETEREGEMSARQWAMEHRLPRRIVQRDGSVIELAAVYDGRPVYLIPLNEDAAVIVGTAHLRPGGRTGLGMTGAGERIGIWDSGHVSGSHVELAGRVDVRDEAETSDHATHVAGTLAATGVDPDARGMAPQASLVSYSWTNDATEMSDEAAQGLLVSNHSYGVLAGWHYGDVEGTGEGWYWLGDPAVSSVEDYMFGRYEVSAVQFDRAAFSYPYFLPVVAAGNDRVDAGPRQGTYRALDAEGGYRTYRVENRPIPADGGADGYDSIAGAGVAKNVLTVGSVGRSTLGGLRTSSFSSFGPTDDGRIKPDLLGAGERVYSLSSSGPEAYARFSGTSMATATVAGSLLLIQQYHNDLFGAYMTAASLKGLALHTANDQDVPGPDYATGWGVLDAERAALQVRSRIENSAAIVESELNDSQQFVREVSVDGSADVRVTLVWTDPPSVRPPRRGSSSLDDATRHLRNDLDVRLIHRESGRIYAPYVLDPSDPGRPAVPGDNRVDPVEQIYLAGADRGAYDIVVTHKDRLHAGAPQPFSLIVSGAQGEAAPVAISHLEAVAEPEGVTLTWRTLFERRAGTFAVERRAESNGKTAADEFTQIGELSVAGTTGRSYRFVDTLSVAGTYRYRIVYRDGSDAFPVGTVAATIPAPDAYAVVSSYPNPFTHEATLVVDLPRAQQVSLEVYDVMGRRVAHVYDGELQAGRHRLVVQGESWAPGVYFARVRTPNGSVAHRIVKH